eukprot:CAMPEP_0197180172 /NCGR_PEP_ID=MMETSP1423-20130617/4872_1 /TAXON_ID=476441 /ORGANISM="Pseudo-nitzschia heimii, Strain UNC1101" /LENGTH=538 /DNA_ID=CAMNT_0042630203 /DNA_START=27 /DNA_END=1643 /DNA_ORIENTATION=-
MTRLQVVHHTDYRSKAEHRKKELEKLQEKGLARTKAAQLRDAKIPKEACNFLEKQRELFAVRRKNRADAIQFLHQFRADDDYVLRTTRHSLGSQDDKRSESRKSAYRFSFPPSQREQERQPDARASIYSFAIYPISTQRTDVSPQKYPNTSNESSSLEFPIHPAEIIENSISFESAFNRLEIAAKEASRLPIPEDDDSFGVDDEEDENHDNNNDTLISGESDCAVASQSSAVPFIPSEAFSKLGESLEIHSDGVAECRDNAVCEPLRKNDSDDDSIIPGESFMQLGASMMGNELVSALVNEEQKATDENEFHYDAEENTDVSSNTNKCASASQSFTDTNLLQQGKCKVSNYGINESTDCDCDRLEREGVIEDETGAPEMNVDKRKIKLCEEGEFPRTGGCTSTNIDGENNGENKIPIAKLFEPKSDSKGAETLESLDVSVNSGAATIDIVRESNRTPKKSNLSVSGCNNTDTYDFDGLIDEEENYQRSEARPEVTSQKCASTREGKQNPRRRRKKKKKEKKSYFPSSSLFVSRQYLSR